MCVREQTEAWVQGVVIKHGLCPFAAPLVKTGNLRIVVSRTNNASAACEFVADELQLLKANLDGSTLAVFPDLFRQFASFLRFLDVVDGANKRLDLEGVIQIASFHPKFMFGDAARGARGHYTNRSPYPTVHLLREDQVSRAVNSHPNVRRIPQRNLRVLQRLDTAAFEQVVRLSSAELAQDDNK
jgi:hypothetical protein